MGVDKLEAGAFARDRGDNRVWRRHLLLFFALVALLIALYWQSWSRLVGVWQHETTYNYCFLIPLVSLYILRARWKEVIHLRPGWSLMGAVACLGAGALWLVSDVADVALGRQVALLALFQGIVLATFGWRVFWGVFFPLQYLWLMIPTWAFLIPSLQKTTLSLAEMMIRITNVPLYVDGLLMEVPSGLYRVAPECSGLNFLLAAAALSLVFGILMYQSVMKRVAAFVISLIVAVLANGARVAVIVLFNHWGGTKIGLAGDHLTWGWGFFAVIVVFMIWLGSRFADRRPEQKITMDDLSVTPRKSYSAAILVVFIPFLIATIFAPYGYAYMLEQDMNADRRVAFALPDKLGGAVHEDGLTSNWNPVFPKADVAVREVYAAQDGNRDLFVAYYGMQQSGKEVVGFDNSFIGHGYRTIAPARTTTVMVNGSPLTVVENHLSNGVGMRLVWSWYWVDGQFTHSDVMAKILQAKATLLGGETRAALVALSAEKQMDAPELRDYLQSWVQQNFPVADMLNGASVTLAETAD